MLRADWTLYVNGQVVETGIKLIGRFENITASPGRACQSPNGGFIVVKTHKGLLYVHHGPYTLTDPVTKP